jgi:UPF0716 family protein affecting phage T7 exclusion
MRKIFFICMLFLSVNAQAQTRNKYNNDNSLKTGHGIAIGGAVFTIAGFLTPPLYTSTHSPNSTSNYNMAQHKLPFYQQGPRATSIVAGITITIAGLITMLSGK